MYVNEEVIKRKKSDSFVDDLNTVSFIIQIHTKMVGKLIFPIEFQNLFPS